MRSLLIASFLAAGCAPGTAGAPLDDTHTDTPREPGVPENNDAPCAPFDPHELPVAPRPRTDAPVLGGVGCGPPPTCYEPDCAAGEPPSFEDQLAFADIVVSGIAGPRPAAGAVEQWAMGRATGEGWRVVALRHQAFAPDGVVAFTANTWSAGPVDERIEGPGDAMSVLAIERVSVPGATSQIIDEEGKELADPYCEADPSALAGPAPSQWLEPGERYLVLLQASTVPLWTVARPAVTVLTPFAAWRFDGATLVDRYGGPDRCWADVAPLVPTALEQRQRVREAWFSEWTRSICEGPEPAAWCSCATE